MVVGWLSAFTRVRLVSESPEVDSACIGVVTGARQVAAARATLSERELPSDFFQELWAAEQAFLTAARRELGLIAMPYEADPGVSSTRWMDRSARNLGC